MLTALRIKNLALAADVTLELLPGLVVITGETGAGKSILIGALNLVLGERADRTLIRSGAEGCTVEAVFDVGRLRIPLASWLEANGIEPCEENQLVLKRTFTAAGANRQFINGTATTLAVLAEAGAWLVDVHGPHDHQSLLQPARQLAVLDAFGNLRETAAKFAELLRRRAELLGQKAALIVDEQTYAQQLDLLRFQHGEINAAGLRPGEDSDLEQEHRRSANTARLLEVAQQALQVLGEEERSLLALSGSLGRSLQELQRIDPGAAPLLSAHEGAAAALRELQSELARYAERVEIDPARLQALEERLNLVQSLKRKYGPTLEAVIVFGEQARERLARLEQRDLELSRIKDQLCHLESELWAMGRALSKQRRQIIPKLEQAARKELADLGFAQSHFEIAITTLAESVSAPGQFGPTGLDSVEFQFAPNPGEPARPLRSIASSGEMARVMLALKTVLAVEDEVPVLVFDEVDANVGGETANAVGEKMRQIARQRQVLCVTHLAPVAASASVHFLVSKEVQAGRTTSNIRRLRNEERVTELARMLGGQSQAARRHAAALLGA